METLKRLDSETSAAYRGFVDYCRMGAQRSLGNLHKLYESSTEDVPTGSLRTLKEWSTKNGWVERARVYDTEAQSDLERQITGRKLRILDRFGELVEDAISSSETTGASLSQVSGAVRTYVDTAMAVADAMPTHRVEIKNTTELSTEELKSEARRLKVEIAGEMAREGAYPETTHVRTLLPRGVAENSEPENTP